MARALIVGRLPVYLRQCSSFLFATMKRSAVVLEEYELFKSNMPWIRSYYHATELTI